MAQSPSYLRRSERGKNAASGSFRPLGTEPSYQQFAERSRAPPSNGAETRHPGTAHNYRVFKNSTSESGAR